MNFEHLSHDFKLWRLNMRLSKGIRGPVSKSTDGFTFASAEKTQLNEIEALHRELFGAPLLGWLKWVYRFRARELITVMLDAEGKVVGYSMFMFNASEVQENLIHEQYVGIAPAYQKQGLSVKLRRFAGDSYDGGTLSGISTLAAVYDLKALRSAQKAGFGITKFSAKPPAHYLFRPLKPRKAAS